MKKKVCLGVAIVSLWSAGNVFAQGEIDAYKFSQSELSGTARYMSMGGAFGALGGDISVMGANPAGLGIYRSSEIVTTLSVSSAKTNTDWAGTTAGSVCVPERGCFGVAFGVGRVVLGEGRRSFANADGNRGGLDRGCGEKPADSDAFFRKADGGGGFFAEYRGGRRRADSSGRKRDDVL